jgi:hypothetical protein
LDFAATRNLDHLSFHRQISTMTEVVSGTKRIPSTLQAVFLSSNRGKDVRKPPPEKIASKMLSRNWFFQRKPVKCPYIPLP